MHVAWGWAGQEAVKQGSTRHCTQGLSLGHPGVTEFFHYFIHLLFCHANKGMITTTAYANLCRRFSLPTLCHLVSLWEETGKRDENRQLSACWLYSFHMRAGIGKIPHWGSTIKAIPLKASSPEPIFLHSATYATKKNATKMVKAVFTFRLLLFDRVVTGTAVNTSYV